MALAYGQDVHRFGAEGAEVAAKAKAASEEALELAPDLEESRFAKAWALQIDERWADAVDAYLELERLEAESIPGRRIKSFALNNAAWITMKELDGEEQELLREAERLLQQAVALYPNKIAYANLAEIARRHRRYDVAEQLFERAVDLDSKYVNGWHEYALLELERAQSDPSRREEYLARSRRLQETAERAADDYDRAKVKRTFERALAEYEATVGTV